MKALTILRDRYHSLLTDTGSLKTGYSMEQIIPVSLIFHALESHLTGKSLDYACTYVRDVLLASMVWDVED